MIPGALLISNALLRIYVEQAISFLMVVSESVGCACIEIVSRIIDVFLVMVSPGVLLYIVVFQ